MAGRGQGQPAHDSTDGERTILPPQPLLPDPPRRTRARPFPWLPRRATRAWTRACTRGSSTFWATRPWRAWPRAASSSSVSADSGWRLPRTSSWRASRPWVCTMTSRASWRILGTQFYLNEETVGKPRAAACRDRLAELNEYVTVEVVSGDAGPRPPAVLLGGSGDGAGHKPAASHGRHAARERDCLHCGLARAASLPRFFATLGRALWYLMRRESLRYTGWSGA